MSGWKDNAIMAWDGDMVTDHGRGPLNMTVERVGTDKRMADGTLRRQYVGVKRSWSATWENIPSTNTVVGGYATVDGGLSGEEIETFYRNTPGAFRLLLRRGSAIDTATPNPSESALPYEDEDFYVVNVMFTDFSKEVRKRGQVDFWSISVTMEEV